MTDEVAIHYVAGGDIAVWLDNSGSICLKSLDKHGDPVELSEHEARDLARLLAHLAEESRG